MPPTITGRAFFTASLDAAVVREDLASQDEGRQLSALMQVVAYMAAGKDMSGLFNSVAALTSAASLRIKRLTYLYLVENSRVQAEKAVLQAGTFVKDTLHDSPLYRGAALRTMTSLQVGVMADFATAPLQRCLHDSDAYVRRAACFGVLKQYCTAPSVTVESGLLQMLPGMLQDDHPGVVAAAVQVMLGLRDRHCPVRFTGALRAGLPWLLRSLRTATEWAVWGLLEGIAESMTLHAARHPSTELDLGQTGVRVNGDRAGSERSSSAGSAVQILPDTFVPRAEEVLRRVLPYTALNNCAVVLAAVKNVVLFLRTVERMTAREVSAAERARVSAKYGPTLVRVLVAQCAAPRLEMRYGALRVIQLLLHSDPDVADGAMPLAVLRPYWAQHLDAFLLRHDDPIYIKLEKLEVLVSLAEETNGEGILSELVVYVTESDPELVKRSVHAIGYLATTLPTLATACVRQLERLLQTEMAHLVEDTVVIVRLILQRYPGRFLDILPTLCAALSVLQEVESKVAVVWIVGEYTDSIPNAIEDYLELFIDNYDTQPLLVQLALLTALAKIYLRHPDTDRTSLERLLAHSITSSVPDLRDRALFYRRLLALDVNVARATVLPTERELPDTRHFFSRTRHWNAGEFDRVLHQLGNLSSILHEPIASKTNVDTQLSDEDEQSSSDVDEPTHTPRNTVDGHATPTPMNESALPAHVTSLTPPPSTTPPPQANRTQPARLSLSPQPAASLTSPARPAAPSEMGNDVVVLSASAANGVEVAMSWSQLDVKLVLNCRFRLLDGDDYVRQTRVLQLQVNRNMFGLGVAQVFPVLTLERGDDVHRVGLIISSNNQKRPTREVEVAIELETIGVRYCLAPPVPASMLLLPASGCEPAYFLAQLKQHPQEDWVMPPPLIPAVTDEARMTTNALRVYGLNLVHRRPIDTTAGNQTTGYFLYAETIARQKLLIELTLQANTILYLSIRCDYVSIAPFFGTYILQCLTQTSPNTPTTML